MNDRGEQTFTTPDGEQHLVDEHECSDGWLGEDLAERPIPCPQCRPHLRRRRGELADAGLAGWTAARMPHAHERKAS